MKYGIGIVAADSYLLYHLLPTCILIERWRIQALSIVVFPFRFLSFSFLFLLANATSFVGYDRSLIAVTHAVYILVYDD